MKYKTKMFIKSAKCAARSAAVLSFIIAVSCAKKEPQHDAPALELKAAITDTTTDTAKADISAIPAAQKKSAQGEPENMLLEVEVPPQTEPQPLRQAAQRPTKTLTPIIPPPVKQEPEALSIPSPQKQETEPPPVSPSVPPPQITVESISGPKVVTVGQRFSMTGNTWTEGGDKPDGFTWRFKNGSDVIERKTGNPQIEITLNKSGEWTVTCGVLWKDKTISSMTIRIQAEAAPVQQDGRRRFRNNDIELASLMADMPIMLAYHHRKVSAGVSDIVSDAAPIMLASSAKGRAASIADTGEARLAVSTAEERQDSAQGQQIAATPAPIAPGAKIEVKGITGQTTALAGGQFVLKCDFGDEIPTVTAYVWRFKNAKGDVFEARTNEPQAAMSLEEIGDYAVTCDIVAEGGTFAAQQQFTLKIVSGQTAINAGGPYNAMMNKPVRVLGNAKSNASRIVKYEWLFGSSDGTPEWSAAENDTVEHTFTRSGEFKAVYKATLADGSFASDTAIISVGSMMPVAYAGADILSYHGRKVKLNGKGRSPDGRIAKYEWDFNGDGIYDWSSDKSGATAFKFKCYSNSVLRVTDTEGNSAEDTMRVIICPKDMVTIEKGKFCIDRYEWPNKRGAVPTANVTAREAGAACAGAGKRLCSADEWLRACRNDRSSETAPKGVFPYGKEYDQTKCNTLDNPRGRNSLMKAGQLGGCAGAVGASDMSGNAAEWASSGDGTAAAFGGFYQSGADGSSCDSRLTLEDDTKYLYVGFRCCK